MRKKIILILLIFVSAFIFSDKVLAKVPDDDEFKKIDHSLNYDIEYFNIDNNGVLTMKGWAFIHNYHNYGGLESDVSVDIDDGHSYKRKFMDEESSLNVYFTFKNGDETLIISNEEYRAYAIFDGDRDLTRSICTKSSGDCWDVFYDYSSSRNGKPISEYYYGYYNVGFEVKIPINDLIGSMGIDKNWSIYINAGLGSKTAPVVSRSEALAIDTKTANDKYSFSGYDLEVDGLGKNVNVIGSHVVYNNSAFSTMVAYWGTSYTSGNKQYYYNYQIDSKNVSSGNSIARYVLKGTPLQIIDNGSLDDYKKNLYGKCGFVYSLGLDSCTSCADKYAYSNGGNKYWNYCTKPCSGGDNCYNTDVSAAFVKPTGSVKIKLIDNSKYCTVNKQGVIGDCNGFDEYSCNSLMTVKYENYVADVYPKENVYLELNDDYHLQTIYSGGGFKLEITYQDVVSFSIENDNYGGTISENGKILEHLATEYIRFKDIASFENNLNKIKVKDMYLNSDIIGSWTCEQSENRNNSEGILDITTDCSFSPYYVYYDYDADKLIYSPDIIEDEKVFDLFYDYYVSMRYCYTKNNGGKYRFNIYSEEDLNLSNLKVAINKEQTDSPKFSIKTNNKSATCYINVRNYFYECDEDINGGSSPSTTITGSQWGDGKFKFVYRSIDINDPFPTISDIRDYKKYPDNWGKYLEEIKSLDRVKNSYSADKMEYRTIELTSEKLKNLRKDLNVNYTSWDNISNDGTSSFVNGNYFKDINRHHSKLGEFNEGADKL